MSQLLLQQRIDKLIKRIEKLEIYAHGHDVANAAKPMAGKVLWLNSYSYMRDELSDD